jgi:hypothetical protein
LASTTDKPHISWLILVYDRTAEERFPFKRKWYTFSYERASEEEIEQVINLCCQKKESDFPPPTKSPKIGDTQISFFVGVNNYTNHRILNYRNLFDFVPDYENNNCHKAKPIHIPFFVNLPHDSYYEDENEKPISLLQVFDEEMRKSGRHGLAIVKDIPESVLRFDPANPIRKKFWKTTDADAFALFFRQFKFIRNSRWINSPCQISPVSKDICHARLPIQEDCMAVILPFRQMYSNNDRDNLFNKVCNIHKRHCPNEHPTYFWVNDYQKDFNNTLNSHPNFPIQNCKINCQRYLNAFAYGAKVVHVKNNEEEPVHDLKYLLDNFQQEMVIMQYHVILRNLMRTMSMVVDVLKKNVGHWINNLRWSSGVDKLSGSEIFNYKK